MICLNWVGNFLTQRDEGGVSIGYEDSYDKEFLDFFDYFNSY